MHIEKHIDEYSFNTGNLLGKGNFSHCYEGVHRKTNQKVAIKITELSSLKSKKLQQLLNQEIQILRTLNSPYILRCHQVFSSLRNCYIITELCDCTLEDYLKKHGSLSQAQLRPILLDIFRGMHYLASKQVVHRDLKISNVLLRENRAKIADFGFAKIAHRNFIDANIGSPLYMSPQGLIQHSYGPKTDVWAFGVLIYELLHGKAPLSKCTTQTALKAEICKPITEANISASVSLELREVIIKCLNINQNQRLTFIQMAHLPYFAGVDTNVVQNQVHLKNSLKRKSKNGALKDAQSCDKDIKLRKIYQEAKSLQPIYNTNKLKRLNTHETCNQNVLTNKNDNTNSNTKQNVAGEFKQNSPTLSIINFQSPRKKISQLENNNRTINFLETNYSSRSCLNKSARKVQLNKHKAQEQSLYIRTDRYQKKQKKHQNLNSDRITNQKNTQQIQQRQDQQKLFTNQQFYSNILPNNSLFSKNNEINSLIRSNNNQFKTHHTTNNFFNKPQSFEINCQSQSNFLRSHKLYQKEKIVLNVRNNLQNSSQIVLKQHARQNLSLTKSENIFNVSDALSKDNIHKLGNKEPIRFNRDTLFNFNNSATFHSSDFPDDKILKTDSMTFKECVNMLHFCRLLFKYLHFAFDPIFATLTLKIIKELIYFTAKRHTIQANDCKEQKNKKLKQVTEDYYKKYDKLLKERILPSVTLQEVIERCRTQKHSGIRNTFICTIYKYTKLLQECGQKREYRAFENAKQIQEILQQAQKSKK